MTLDRKHIQNFKTASHLASHLAIQDHLETEKIELCVLSVL